MKLSAVIGVQRSTVSPAPNQTLTTSPVAPTIAVDVIVRVYCLETLALEYQFVEMAAFVCSC